MKERLLGSKLHAEVSALAVWLEGIRLESEYELFVHEWKLIEVYVVTMIVEHKNGRKAPRYAREHQMMAAHYGNVARELYRIRELGKTRLKSGEIINDYEKPVKETLVQKALKVFA